VAGAPLLGLLVTILVALVPGCTSASLTPAAPAAVEGEDDVLDPGLFRHFEALRSLRSTSQRRRVDLHLAGKLLRSDSHSATCRSSDWMRSSLVGHRAAGSDAGIANRADQLLQGQILTHLRLELRCDMPCAASAA
jgi:hypothetical protein